MNRPEENMHHESRRHPNQCECGYQATDSNDLDEHIVVASRSEVGLFTEKRRPIHNSDLARACTRCGLAYPRMYMSPEGSVLCSHRGACRRSRGPRAW